MPTIIDITFHKSGMMIGFYNEKLMLEKSFFFYDPDEKLTAEFETYLNLHRENLRLFKPESK